MSAAATTDTTEAAERALRDAARGVLPAWAEVSSRRREHVARVAALMAAWADALRLPPAERDRWVAAAWLHDALRDADPERLRAEVPPAFRDLDGLLLHGPAAAERIEPADAEVAHAVRFHTLGHPYLTRLGRALYLADFLEPGRDFLPEWRASLRARVPGAMDDVLRDVVRARLEHVREKRDGDLHPATLDFARVVGAMGAEAAP